jgi:heme-degrading monooxygenase HmoA
MASRSITSKAVPIKLNTNPGEVSMTVKIHIKRKIKQGALKEVSAMLIRARKNAMVQKGYISTETLVDFNDPNKILVVSMWQKKEDWDNYATSAARRENEKNFEEILAAATEYEIYTMGLG